MKTIGFFCYVVIIAMMTGCTLSGGKHLECHDFKYYRYNPFQFHYDEYFLKADIIRSVSFNHEEENSVGVLNLYGLKAKIDERYFDEVVEAKSPQSDILVKKDNEIVFLAGYEKERFMGCKPGSEASDHKDLCSAFGSSKEFNIKLFRLTPEDLPNLTIGEKWIVHMKGIVLKNTASIRIYKLDDLVAFRQNFKDNTRIKTQIFIFPDAMTPDWVTLVFTDVDERLIEQLLYSINANQNRLNFE